MSGGALGLALGAAFLHALWNVLLAGSRDSVAATGALLLFGVVLLAPAALVAGGVLTLGLSSVGPLRRHMRDSEGPHSRELLLGLAIGVAIAGYTLVDSEGLDHADPLPYLFLIAAVSAVAYNGALIASGMARELKEALGGRALGTAAATFGAYAMVLAALELAPAAPVAAVRESSIVIAALMAWLFLGEERRVGGGAAGGGGGGAVCLAVAPRPAGGG